jgi:rhodanese-related sulfurtransferase
MKNLSQEAWISAIAATENAVIIDVRTPEECASGIVKNALMLDFFKSEFFRQEIEQLDKSMTYYVYCRSGNRSSHACTMMESMGFPKTVNLLGGMNAWSAPKVMPNS